MHLAGRNEAARAGKPTALPEINAKPHLIIL